jgi:DNA mismatch repair protein MutS2
MVETEQAASLQVLEWSEVRRMVRERTATPLGSAQAEAMEPWTDPDRVVAERRLTVQCHSLLRERERLPFHRLGDVSSPLRRLDREGIRLDGLEVYDLCLLLQNAGELRAFLERMTARGAAVEDLAMLAGRLPDLACLREEIGPHVSSSGEVLDSASRELRSIRRRLSHLSEKLKQELQAIIDRSDSSIFLRDEYITIRNGRFVLPIRTDSPVPVPGIMHGRSSTGLTHFVEPLTTVAINNEIVGLREAEEEEVDRILREYTRLLQGEREAVRDTASIVGRFDLIQGRARLALDQDGTPAAESAEERVVLQEARHPLLQESLAAQGASPVPISLELGGKYPILIISGPNTGGKTVALKTVGLLVLMNQSGLLLPALGAELPVFRRVLVDIGDHQSIAANLSTFSAHMKNIAWMTGQVQAPTLVLLDEIGTGTDPEEGAALGVAILEHFRRHRALVVVTTHMSGIKSHGYSTPGVKNASVEFDPETLRPTFRILMGVAGSSSGIEIARRLGLPDGLVEDARSRLGSTGLEADAYLQRIRETLEEVTAERERLSDEARSSERSRQEAGDEARRREKLRGQIFRQELAAVVERHEQALREQIRGIQDKALRRKLEKEARKRIEETTWRMEREARERFDEDVQAPQGAPDRVSAGDRVRISSLGQVGRVEETTAGDRVRVEVGGKTVTVSRGDLVWLEPAGDAPRQDRLPARVTLQSAEKDSPRRELNLVGRTVDEAMGVVDKFLDDAFLADLETVRLVHGHGTGVLRRAIAEFLKTHPHVANYHLAEDREGGTGVTVVDLRR